MNLLKPKANLAQSIFDDCQNKLTTVILDLSVKETNFFCGSGLGGNEFQAMTLISLEHNLSTLAGFKVKAENGAIFWEPKWLLSSSLKKIRKELDSLFKTLDESYFSILNVLNSNNIELHCRKFEDNLPQIKKIFSGQSVKFKNVSPDQEIVLAYLICQKFSKELDSNITNNIQSVGETLSSFPYEVILLAVRKFIGIMKIVQFNLDDHPAWSDMFNSISRKVN